MKEMKNEVIFKRENLALKVHVSKQGVFIYISSVFSSVIRWQSIKSYLENYDNPQQFGFFDKGDFVELNHNGTSIVFSQSEARSIVKLLCEFGEDLES
jgi:hypothetical protein